MRLDGVFSSSMEDHKETLRFHDVGDYKVHRILPSTFGYSAGHSCLHSNITRRTRDQNHVEPHLALLAVWQCGDNHRHLNKSM
jgi:hypothetical protein